MSESFEDKMKAMKDLSDEEMAKRIEEVKAICASFCGECPSYTGTGETELGFCITDKSKAITEEKGCLCTSCPITSQMSLRWKYFCTLGSAGELSEAEK